MTREVVFVFGSNRQGRHGKGAAKEAACKFGAIHGQPEGLQGKSYAIITKELRSERPPVTLDLIADGVQRFISFARSHPEMIFLVTPIGCGLAGFRAEQVAPLFAGSPENVQLPDIFLKVILG